MRKYTTEYSHGKLVTTEFNWSMTKDTNRISIYNEIEDAMDEMILINSIIDEYDNRIDSYNLGGYHNE